MITDREANLVYFAEYLKKEYPSFFETLTGILRKYGIDFTLLPYTDKNCNNLWCRDYMPVQISRHRFVQFKYDPCYLRGLKSAVFSRDSAKELIKTVSK
ncbi:MAG: peptidylarginine deiminase-like protein [Candidatus Omnitrophica bacterium]|nr:peptidylarginine deiminase-like protein [Candidatus Omnitrophota bacterium]